MRWIEVSDIEVTPEGNVEMVVKATGKPLVLSIAQIRHRNGNVIFIDNWLHDRLQPYLIPGGGSDHGTPHQADGNPVLGAGPGDTCRRTADG